MGSEVCRCHANESLYGSLQRCPRCGHRSYEQMGPEYGACERRRCAYEAYSLVPVGTTTEERNEMTDQQTVVDPNDWLLQGGARSASFPQIGATVTGYILRQPDVQQVRDFQSQQPKFWPDGRPQNQLRVILMTEDQDPSDPEDSGERALYIRGGNMQKAVAEAVRKEGAAGLEVGGKLQVIYSGDGQPTQRGFNPPKLYTARYKKPEPRPVPVEVPQQQTTNGAVETVDPESIPF